MQSDTGTEGILSTYYLFLSMVYCDSYDFVEAQSRIEKALSLSQKNNEKIYEGMSKIWFGRILGKKGQSEFVAAKDYIQDGIKILERLMIKPWIAEGYLFMGELDAIS